MKYHICGDCGDKLTLSKYERFVSLKKEHKPSIKFHSPLSSIGRIGFDKVLDRLQEQIYNVSNDKPLEQTSQR